MKDFHATTRSISQQTRTGHVDAVNNVPVRPLSDGLSSGQSELRKLTVNKLQFEEGTLYGREQEIDQLLHLFDRSKTSIELILISGEAGTGKSSLAETLRHPVYGAGGFYMAGKFDQQQRDVPYSGITNACEGLCSELMEHADPLGSTGKGGSSNSSVANISNGGSFNSSCSTGNMSKEFLRYQSKGARIRKNKWKFSMHDLKTVLHSAMGPDQSILMSIIPSLYPIFDPEANDGTDEVVNFSRDAKTQLLSVVRRFFRALCEFRPVCLCLDDTQWADLASLDLLEAIITDPLNQNLTVITSYRSTEVSDYHIFNKLVRTLEGVKARSNFYMTKIRVGNINTAQIHALLSDVLIMQSEKTIQLADLTFQKTQGNVFHVIQFLQSLVANKLLTYALGLNVWSFNVENIAESSGPTANVVELITARINNLDDGVTCLLPVVACLGANFSIQVAKLVIDHFGMKLLPDRPDEVYSTLDFLEVCVKEGLLVNSTGSSYKWVHDKIQESALLLLQEEESRRVQFSVGELLLKELPDDLIEDMMFVITSLLEQDDLLMDQVDATMCVQLVKVNLRAGVSAIRSSAFQSAEALLSRGISLLPVNKWQSEYYDLCLRLHSRGAEAAFIRGNFECMQKYCDEIIAQKDHPLIDKRSAYNVLVHSYIARGYLEKAKVLSIEILAKLGCKFPRNLAVFPAVVAGLLNAKKSVDTAMTAITEAPDLEDESQIWTMELLDALTTCLYQMQSDLLPIAILKGYKYTLQAGISKYTPIMLALVALLLGGVLNDLKGATKVADKAVTLAQSYRSTQSRTLFLTSFMSLSCKIPAEICKKTLLRGYEIGLATGDTGSSGFCIMGYLHFVWYFGGSLESLMSDCRIYCNQLKGFGQSKIDYLSRFIWQIVENVVSGDFTDCSLYGSYLVKEEFDAYLNDSHDEHSRFHYNRFALHSAFWLGDYERAIQIMQERKFDRGASEKQDPAGFVSIPLNFHMTLSCLYYSRSTGKRKYLKIARKIYRRKIMVHIKGKNPNVGHYVSLVRAEMEASKGHFHAARKFYDAAIGFAQRRGMTNYLGLAHELKGKHRLEVGDVEDSTYHLGCAMRCYNEWGATTKENQLLNQFPSVFLNFDSSQKTSPTISQANINPIRG